MHRVPAKFHDPTIRTTQTVEQITPVVAPVVPVVTTATITIMVVAETVTIIKRIKYQFTHGSALRWGL